MLFMLKLNICSIMNHMKPETRKKRTIAKLDVFRELEKKGHQLKS